MMHDELWAGVELKVEYAEFFLKQMGESLQPPERTHINVVLQSTGAIIDTRWQESFYAYLDAFLAMVRSVPEIINACFGADRSNAVMNAWFGKLATPEQARRETFSTRFKTIHDSFRNLPLSNARNISLHRTGVAPVEVKIGGRFGIAHVGNPVKRVPHQKADLLSPAMIRPSNGLPLSLQSPCNQPGWILGSMGDLCFLNVKRTSMRPRNFWSRLAVSLRKFTAVIVSLRHHPKPTI